MFKRFHILLLNGPNLNYLGTRESKLYGKINFKKIIKIILKKAEKLNIKLTHYQSNAEYKLIDIIQKKHKEIDFILINPAALTHTSIALRDAFLCFKIPFYEIHLSNIYAREKFRQKSYLSDISNGIISGFHIDGYIYALQSATKFLLKNKKYKK